MTRGMDTDEEVELKIWRDAKDMDIGGLHSHIIRRFGRASHCENNLTHYGPFNWANLDQRYGYDISDYVQLCASCHKLYDNGKIKIRGLNIIERGGIPHICGFKSGHNIWTWRKEKELSKNIIKTY